MFATRDSFTCISFNDVTGVSLHVRLIGIISVEFPRVVLIASTTLLIISFLLEFFMCNLC